MKELRQMSLITLTSKTRFFLLLLGLLISISSMVNAQVNNGSFENSSGPTLENWQWTCGAESFASAPTGGGSWCIKVLAGNIQSGCGEGLAYQKLEGISPDEVYELSGYEFSEEPGIWLVLCSFANQPSHTHYHQTCCS
jgi:hypothetical protein